MHGACLSEKVFRGNGQASGRYRDVFGFSGRVLSQGDQCAGGLCVGCHGVSGYDSGEQRHCAEKRELSGCVQPYCGRSDPKRKYNSGALPKKYLQTFDEEGNYQETNIPTEDFGNMRFTLQRRTEGAGENAWEPAEGYADLQIQNLQGKTAATGLYIPDLPVKSEDGKRYEYRFVETVTEGSGYRPQDYMDSHLTSAAVTLASGRTTEIVMKNVKAGSISIQKKYYDTDNPDGKAGKASFELYKKTGAGFEKVKEETIETAENGTAMISDLPVKEGQGENSTRTAYYLKETLPPDAEMRPGEIKGSAKVEEKDGGYYFGPLYAEEAEHPGQQILANYKPIGKAVVYKAG